MGDVGDYWRDHKEYEESVRDFTCCRCGKEFSSAYRGRPERARCRECQDRDRREG